MLNKTTLKVVTRGMLFSTSFHIFSSWRTWDITGTPENKGKKWSGFKFSIYDITNYAEITNWVTNTVTQKTELVTKKQARHWIYTRSWHLESKNSSLQARFMLWHEILYAYVIIFSCFSLISVPINLWTEYWNLYTFESELLSSTHWIMWNTCFQTYFILIPNPNNVEFEMWSVP